MERSTMLITCSLYVIWYILAPPRSNPNRKCLKRDSEVSFLVLHSRLKKRYTISPQVEQASSRILRVQERITAWQRLEYCNQCHNNPVILIQWYSTRISGKQQLHGVTISYERRMKLLWKRCSVLKVVENRNLWINVAVQ